MKIKTFNQNYIIIEPIYAVLQTRTSNIKTKHSMLGIDERMEKLF